jgi:hypothetical protein
VYWVRDLQPNEGLHNPAPPCIPCRCGPFKAAWWQDTPCLGLEHTKSRLLSPNPNTHSVPSVRTPFNPAVNVGQMVVWVPEGESTPTVPYAHTSSTAHHQHTPTTTLTSQVFILWWVVLRVRRLDDTCPDPPGYRRLQCFHHSARHVLPFVSVAVFSSSSKNW